VAETVRALEEAEELTPEQIRSHPMVREMVRDHFGEIRDEAGYSVPSGVADELSALLGRLR
jgi:hypothetical protein